MKLRRPIRYNLGDYPDGSGVHESTDVPTSTADLAYIDIQLYRAFNELIHVFRFDV